MKRSCTNFESRNPQIKSLFDKIEPVYAMHMVVDPPPPPPPPHRRWLSCQLTPTVPEPPLFVLVYLDSFWRLSQVQTNALDLPVGFPTLSPMKTELSPLSSLPGQQTLSRHNSSLTCQYQWSNYHAVFQWSVDSIDFKLWQSGLWFACRW